MKKQTNQPDLSELYQQSKVVSSTSLDDQLCNAAKAQAEIYSEAASNTKNGWINKITWVPALAFSCLCLVGISFVLKTDNDLLINNEPMLDEQVVIAELSDETIDASSLDTLSNILRENSFSDGTQLRRQAQQRVEIQTENIGQQAFQNNNQPQVIEDIVVSAAITDFEFNLSEMEEDGLTSAGTTSIVYSSNLEENNLAESVLITEAPALINLAEYIPDLVIELRYFGYDNFIGEPVEGYLSEKALLTEAAAKALLQVQQQANNRGLGLKVFDAYRPQRSVDHFLYWAKQPDNSEIKANYYPNIEKSELFSQGYLSEQFSHSRGSTVDLTLIDKESGEELDMGTNFDFFDAKSWALSREVSEQAQENRRLLRSLMVEQGFEPFESEWWHFTLKNEPYLNQYFNQPVE